MMSTRVVVFSLVAISLQSYFYRPHAGLHRPGLPDDYVVEYVKHDSFSNHRNTSKLRSVFVDEKMQMAIFTRLILACFLKRISHC
jgi:hypothetical protein